ncbi:VOC family protein [Nocardioides jensenii]|uniref:VOC family protein n=1 Tax=Nocardioides jensenii TaxID=1843 RepID=UPI0008326775|nr:VOC family protein [Nocardioides jensenii]
MPAIGGDETTGPGLHHVGFVVPKMEPGIRRFVDAGGEVLLGPTDDHQLHVTCVLIRLPEGVDVELVAPLADAESPLTARLKRGGGLDHLCFWVDDLDASLAREIENDAMLLVPPTYAVTFDSTVAFVQRRGGLVVELMGAKR